MTGQILIVENDPMIVQVSRDLLCFDRHTVISAEDGMEGLQLYSAGQFDVVITDVKMPKMDGIELLIAIKSKDPAVEVIVITGFSSVELAIDIIRYGGYDFLQKPDDVTRLHRKARQIQKTGHRAASLIQQLLTLSRSQVMKPELTDLNRVIQDIHPMLDRLLTDHIDFRAKLMDQSDMILADQTQLEQVIVNLAVNARDAMEEGGTLTIETRLVRLDTLDAKLRSLKHGKYILLSVTDTGQGMDEKVKAHLFEPFFTTKEKGKGRGLGLATVYGIVTQSNGHIDVISAPGEGTTFSIYLPVAITSIDSKIQEKQVNVGDNQIYETGTETILIVENENDIREIMGSILEEAGHSIYEAENGVDALECLKEHAADIQLVISDLFMPKMMGSMFIEKVLDAYTTIKVLMISGTMEETKVSETLFLNEFPFLPKPFTPDDLLKQARSALDMPQFNPSDSIKN